MNPRVFYNKLVIDHSASVFTTPNDFITKASNKNIPKNKITAGPLGTSIFHEKNNPNMVTIVPPTQAIVIRDNHFCVNKMDIDAGIIKNADLILSKEPIFYQKDGKILAKGDPLNLAHNTILFSASSVYQFQQ